MWVEVCWSGSPLGARAFMSVNACVCVCVFGVRKKAL